MTDQHPTPPPHLLKKFSEQARVDSQKRGHPGYCKTFARLCIEWAFQEVELNSQSTPNDCQIRSSDIDPLPELIEQWMQNHATKYDLARHAAQWGADQELEACRMEIIDGAGLFYLDETSDRVRLAEDLWSARRPKPLSLKNQGLQALGRFSANAHTTADEMTADFELLRQVVEQLHE